MGALLHRYGAVVSRDTLGRAGWPDGAPGRNALDVHMLISSYCVFRVANLPKGWFLKRVTLNGEDVTDKDVKRAIAEGFDSIELAKRYTTVTMGPCQGRLCHVNSIRVYAKATGLDEQTIGTTTARPPYTPVKMGLLAGRPQEPVKRTALHHRHEELGATMMWTGAWKRPHSYGPDPGAEAKHVHDAVGLIDVSTLGKILVTGQTFVLYKGYNFVLVRYNNDGSLDASFGTGGIVSTGFGTISEDGISDALLQPDGKILAVGLTDAAPDRIFDFALARYNSDGSLDTTFGVEGRVTTSFGSGDAFGTAAVLQPDGRIIVVGQNLTPDSGFNFALARYHSDGSLDTGFGDNGTISTDLGGGDDIAWAVVLQPDGKAVLAGTSQLNFALARYLVQEQAIEVTIDIKPGSDTNHINPNSRGRTNVAILSTPEFDALAMIDRRTLRFGRTGEEESLHSCKEKGRDDNSDGLRDLI